MNPIILDPDTKEPVNIFQELLNSRIFFLSGIIDEAKAKEFVANVMLLNLKSTEDKITIFINSGGGDIRSVFMIHDVLKLISCPVEFIIMGACEKEAIILLGAPKNVKRLATKNSLLLVDQLSYAGVQYSALEDVKVINNILSKDNKKFIKILAEQVGRTESQVKSDLENKKYFSPKKAIEYGLIDDIATAQEVSSE
jgi:ATP-dependent Clp protease protease subunit